MNAVSIILFFTLYSFIYTELSNKNIPIKFSKFSLITSLLPIALILVDKINFKLILGIVSFISTLTYIKKFIIDRSIKDINILPINKASAQKFTIGMVIFSFIIIYLFNIDTMMACLFFQIIFLIMEIFFIIYIKDRENIYENTYNLFYLSEYMEDERDEFARIIHDEIIQDIFAARNYLSLKNSDINHAREILINLEKRLREMMKFYQANLFVDVNIDTSIEGIFFNISSLYPEKEIKVQKTIDEKLLKENNKKLTRFISIISKELINNIYKHSKATFLNYKLSIKDDFIVLELESDGTNEEDYEKIKKSQRGILLLKILINSNAGNIKYDLNKDLLSTKVKLEVRNETSFIR
ncbi:histidine kinase [Peptoniphilus sp.]|uniref:histidine kinase n=1 Tax=Peptoniphilus sp. TaxID=1971214 RepID=UPI002A82D4EB|nr:histidine kinase [Peptoniphilus sp.]MDY3902974.1 histidine kinase [Peptoniphilus sp.]